MSLIEKQNFCKKSKEKIVDGSLENVFYISENEKVIFNFKGDVLKKSFIFHLARNSEVDLRYESKASQKKIFNNFKIFQEENSLLNVLCLMQGSKIEQNNFQIFLNWGGFFNLFRRLNKIMYLW